MLIFLAVLMLGQPPAASAAASEPEARPSVAGAVTIRVATFNIEDVRSEDVLNPEQPRLKRLAEVIQRIRPNVILLNEMAYDGAGAAAGSPAGQNAKRFVENFLMKPQAPGLEPMTFQTFMAPVNTGVASGLDLNRDGKIVTSYPPVPGSKADGSAGKQTAEGRAYGEDCWGFGMFPGQYGMALLVDPKLTIDGAHVRTFRLYPWSYLPGAFAPEAIDASGAKKPGAASPDPAGSPEKSKPGDGGAAVEPPKSGKPWYSPEAWEQVRLSSKSHWDVPVRLPNGATVHFLCSHPTPPVFDGPEDRNGKRNHDEIRFWRDYIENEPHIVDDAGNTDGLARNAHFVILGDMNADASGKGDSFRNPMARQLFSCKRVNSEVTPKSDVVMEGLRPEDTARFKMRVDYVLPSTSLTVGASGIWREPPTGGPFPSDHFPVWVEVTAPASAPR